MIFLVFSLSSCLSIECVLVASLTIVVTTVLRQSTSVALLTMFIRGLDTSPTRVTVTVGPAILARTRARDVSNPRMNIVNSVADVVCLNIVVTTTVKLATRTHLIDRQEERENPRKINIKSLNDKNYDFANFLR